ncbi:MAG TPA: HEAT repeat domain-containing protein [Dictyobacter sp.]|jgi:HEAT repeat protein|nr:HEAT repeat domain-containing protein [Dictyobacter sp.]
MSDRNEEQTQQPVAMPEGNAQEPGFWQVEEAVADPGQTQQEVSRKQQIKPSTPLPAQAYERPGTTEHLAAQRPVPEINENDATIKERLRLLRTEVTRLLTSQRWENQSITVTAQRLIPLLNVGPVQQWKDVLIPFLYEIDRAGALIPTWITIIEQGDTENLPSDANPADTTQGRARRFAILMLGKYRMMGISNIGNAPQLTQRSSDGGSSSFDIAAFLGQLATDPNTSLYATQALVQHATVPAMQALIKALEQAKGWARVDVITACLSLHQEHFYDLVLAGGLNDAPGLENYIALAIYREIPLEHFLQRSKEITPPLRAHTAQIVGQVLLDSSNPPLALNANNNTSSELPPIFTRHLPTVAQALFADAQQDPTWQHAIAIHYLGTFMGRYWNEVNKGTLKDGRIIEQIYQLAPMMNDVERWIRTEGRDVMLNTLSFSDDLKAISQTASILGELQDPRTVTPILTRIETTTTITDRSHALMIDTLCNILGKLDDQRAASALFQMANRTLNIPQRTSQGKQSNNLAQGDANIPGSIVYAAVIRTGGILGDTAILQNVIQASHDLDPYVRTQAVEAVKRLDASGNNPQSRQLVHEALHDPNDKVVRAACQTAIQYKDNDAIPYLEQLTTRRPELSYLAQDALQRIRR